MKKLFLIFLMALMLGACASVTYTNANGQKVKACTTDFECLQKNGF